MADPTDKEAGSSAPAASRPGRRRDVDRLTTPSTTPLPASSSPAPSASAGSRTSSPCVGSATRSSSHSSARAPYVPQFSAATQMILKRMRGETGGLGSALASAAAPGAARLSFPQSTYDRARERITAHLGGGAGLSMPMPAPSSSSPSPATTTTNTTTGGTTSATLPLPLSSSSSPRPTGTGTAAAAPPPPPPPSSSARPASGQKRKRGSRDDAGGSGASSPAEASDHGEGTRRPAPPKTPASSASASVSASATPTTTTTTMTMTKSGRHVLKPDTYDPAAEDNARRRSRLGAAARTAEQALCKRCTRMHSPATNQMVFCDGCNDPWHQRCHEPWIEDDVVRDTKAEWYCAACAAKRERMQPRKKAAVVEKPRLGSWAGRSAVQKRAYLSGLPQADLVGLLLRATELHPDLPIFPAEAAAPPKKAAAAMPRSLFAGTSTEGLFGRGDANPTAPMNFIRKIPANAKKSTMAKARSGPGSLQSKADAQAQAARSSSGHQLLREDEDSSFTKLWPRPGKGMYGRLPPEADDDRQLVDGSDYDAFSVIVFNEKGKMVEENGVKV